MITDTEISIFCNNVKVLRERNGLSSEKMAEICGITLSSLMLIERGVLPSDLTIDIAIRLYRYFKISPENLFRPL